MAIDAPGRLSWIPRRELPGLQAGMLRDQGQRLQRQTDALAIRTAGPRRRSARRGQLTPRARRFSGSAPLPWYRARAARCKDFDADRHRSSRTCRPARSRPLEGNQRTASASTHPPA